VRPCIPVRGAANRVLADSVYIREGGHRFDAPADMENCGASQLRVVVGLPLWARGRGKASSVKGVVGVFPGRYPLKVFRTVVGFVEVLVIDMGGSVAHLAKSLRNNPVNGYVLFLATAVQIHRRVSGLPVLPYREKPPGGCLRFPGCASGSASEASYSPEIANHISASIPGNIDPYLAGDTTSKVVGKRFYDGFVARSASKVRPLPHRRAVSGGNIPAIALAEPVVSISPRILHFFIIPDDGEPSISLPRNVHDFCTPLTVRVGVKFGRACRNASVLFAGWAPHDGYRAGKSYNNLICVIAKSIHGFKYTVGAK